MIGINWRAPIQLIKNEVLRAKSNGQKAVSMEWIEFVLNNAEASIAQKHEEDILDEINETSLKGSYLKDLEKYAEYVKTENDMHRQYTQLVISAGYAGYFGLWAIISNRHESLSPIQSTWLDYSLILVTISVISFVFLEVAKIGITGFNLHFKNVALIKAKAGYDFEEKRLAMNGINKYEHWVTIWISRIWIITYPISMATGLGGLFVLLIVLLSRLPTFN